MKSSTSTTRETEIARLTRERDEALEREKASAEVLRVIKASPGELEPVFQAILENAVRICEAKFGMVHRFDQGRFHFAAEVGTPSQLAEFQRQRGPFLPVLGGTLHRVMLTKQVGHTADESAEAVLMPSAKLGGARSLVAVPMVKDEELIGAIVIYRQEVRPFTEKQIALVQNFAAEAVIAIDNARLLTELRESLQQQTATADVLKIISRSTFDLQAALNTLVESAARLCEADTATIHRPQAQGYQYMVSHGLPPEFDEYMKNRPIVPDRGTILGRAILGNKTVHIDDVRADPEYKLGEASRLGGFRTVLAVPLQREGTPIGVIMLTRASVRPFTDKQIELVNTFADQAVIAIENARLLNELRQRTAELTESLEQQTATAEVLSVISSSPGELRPVFEAMLEKAARICQASFGTIYRFDGKFHTEASLGQSPELAEFRRHRGVFLPPAGVPLDRMLRTKALVRSTDDTAEAVMSPAAQLGGARSHVAVPMFKDDQLVGAITLYRREVRPFTDKQVELLTNFAAQAVIAIENARLLNELRESLQQQTATADVLKVISRSTFDLQAVLNTLVESASRFSDAYDAVILLRQGEFLVSGAHHGPIPQGLTGSLPLSRTSAAGRSVVDRKTIHVRDLMAAVAEFPETHALAARMGFRAILCVPLLREGEAIGCLSMRRMDPRPFSAKQIELAETFADQAVIAIENARLLNELRETLQQQTATADVLKIISRSTFDLQTVLNTLVESAGRLCEADTAAIRSPKDTVYHHVASYGMPPGFSEFMRQVPLAPGRGSVVGRVLLEKKAVHIHDVLADPEFVLHEPQKKIGLRTVLGVPLMREGTLIGALVLTRNAMRPFTDKQIELVNTFADQAVIAIENVRLFDEIQDKNRALAEASQHKSQFLANMSHELRTPLNAILGYTELIIDGVYGDTPEKARAALQRVESNGRHLLGLINDVLDFSKIEAGQLKLAPVKYSMKDVVYTVFNAVEPLAAKKKLNFKVDVPPDMPGGYGDERKLTQVLLNLVGNAIKFTDAGEIGIKVASAGDSFKVAVHDTGPGIALADQERLFEEFQQADNSITKTKGGTGLGLAISRRIIEMHGGRLWVDSRPGNGSVFTFTVPTTAEGVDPS